MLLFTSLKPSDRFSFTSKLVEIENLIKPIWPPYVRLPIYGHDKI
jgi:hypothetical protein